MTSNSQLTLISNADVYAPASLGVQHVLVAAGKIVYIGPNVPELDDVLNVQRIDANGAAVLPGFIDAHTHITGGGGEAGFATRVPPVALSQFTRAGVTTVVGLLGTDDIVRNTESVVAQVYALREEGLSAYCYTGGYHIPPTTLTGSVQSDIVFIEPVIAVGELAISDHRSSQPTLDELLKVAAQAHVAHLMTGKAGVVHLHLGDGERGLELVHQALAQSELPARVFNPTHVNRRKALFDEACQLTAKGCYIDITAFETGEVGYEPFEAAKRYLDGGFDASKLTMSSDGGGCLPTFDAEGRMTQMDFANSTSLTSVFYELLDAGFALSTILPIFTSNVAELMCFAHKGKLAIGADADLLILNDKHRIAHVMANGQWHVFNQSIIKKGTFES